MAEISEATKERITQAWPQILAAVAAGDLIRDTLKAHGISADEMRRYRTAVAGAQAAWETAREASAEAFMDEAVDTARHPYKVLEPEKPGDAPTVIRLDAGHIRNLIDTLKWAARIRNPRAYSEKAQLDVNVRTVDLTRIIEAANARLTGGRVIEHNSVAALADAHATPMLLAPALRTLEELT